MTVRPERPTCTTSPNQSVDDALASIKEFGLGSSIDCFGALLKSDSMQNWRVIVK